MNIKAFKMDGLGNDFVIIDQRTDHYNLSLKSKSLRYVIETILDVINLF